MEPHIERNDELKSELYEMSIRSRQRWNVGSKIAAATFVGLGLVNHFAHGAEWSDPHVWGVAPTAAAAYLIGKLNNWYSRRGEDNTLEYFQQKFSEQ